MFMLTSAGGSKKTLEGKLELSGRKVKDSELCSVLCGVEELTAVEELED